MTAAAPVFDPTWPLVRERDLEDLYQAWECRNYEVQCELQAVRDILDGEAHQGRNDEQHD